MPGRISNTLVVAGTGLALLAALGVQGWQHYTHWQSWQTIPAVRAVPPPTRANPQPATIVSRHLFGQPNEAPVAAPQPENLPETHLKLILRGISDDRGGNLDGALIEGPDRKTEFYRPGDSITGGARLKAVHADSVVLDRGGKLEILRFPDSDLNAGFEPSDRTASFTGGETMGAAAAGQDATVPDVQAITSDEDAVSTLSTLPVVGTPVVDEARRAEIREKLRKLKERIQAESNGSGKF